MVEDHDPELPLLLEQQREQARWNKWRERSKTVLLVCLVLAVGILAPLVWVAANLANDLDAQRDQFIYCQSAKADDPKCQKPVTTKKDIEQGKQGLQGIPGIPGPQGPIGPQGPAPSFASILRAVSKVAPDALARYCSAHDQCRGKPGINGKDGINGINGLNGEKGDKGDPGSVVPGVYQCGPSQYQYGFRVNDDGTAEVLCRNRGIREIDGGSNG